MFKFQIDQSCLEALPDSIRAEIQGAYANLASKNEESNRGGNFLNLKQPVPGKFPSKRYNGLYTVDQCRLENICDDSFSNFPDSQLFHRLHKLVDPHSVKPGGARLYRTKKIQQVIVVLMIRCHLIDFYCNKLYYTTNFIVKFIVNHHYIPLHIYLYIVNNTCTHRHTLTSENLQLLSFFSEGLSHKF